MPFGLPPANFHQMMVKAGLYANQGKVTCGNIECDTSLGEFCHRGLGECRPCSDSCGPQHELKPSRNCLQNCYGWLVEQVQEQYEYQMQMTTAVTKPPTTTASTGDIWTSWPCLLWTLLAALAIIAAATLAVLYVLERKKNSKLGKRKDETLDIEMNAVEGEEAENEANRHGDQGVTALSHLLDPETNSSGYNSSRTPSPPDTPETSTPNETRAAQSSANLPVSSPHQMDLPRSGTSYPPSRQGESNVSTPTQARPQTPALASQCGSPASGSAARINQRNHQNSSRLHQAARDSAIASTNSLELDLESTRDVRVTNQTTGVRPAPGHQPHSARGDGSERLQRPSYCPPYPETAHSNPV